MMAIRELRADRLRIPFRRPFPTATGMWLERETWILRLVDADGRVGLGEAVLDAEAGDVADTILAALIREAVTAAATDGLPSRGALELHGTPGRALNAALDSARLDLERDAPAPILQPDDEGVGVNATSPDELKRAVNEAMDSGKPTLINAVLDPAAGSESGRIGNLNPQSAVSRK